MSVLSIHNNSSVQLVNGKLLPLNVNHWLLTGYIFLDFEDEEL